MIKLATGALAVMLATSAAQAQDVDCESAEDQQSINYCAAQDWEKADAALNAVYKTAATLLAGIDADLPQDEQGAVENLKTAQRSWIAFRDAACVAEGYLMHGGSAESMIVFGCLSRLTKARTADLEALVQSY